LHYEKVKGLRGSTGLKGSRGLKGSKGLRCLLTELTEFYC
jgi:hypothetical protein